MTGIEKIKIKIIEDAREKGLHFEEQAAQEAREIIAEASLNAERKRTELLEKAKCEGEEIYRRNIAIAGLDGRKDTLAAKQEMVDTAFKKAMERIIQLPDKEYQKLLEDMVIGASTSGSGEILLSEKDLNRIDSRFISNLNSRLNDKGISGNLVLSKETIHTVGGFVLRRGDIEMNSTLEILFGMLRTELENDVVRILFN